MMTTQNDSKIIVALDYDNAEQAIQLAKQLDPTQCKLKVGKELFTASGPALIDALHHEAFDLFLDLKFHDIPNTVSKACQAAANLGVWMLNVHASGGSKMMEAGLEGIDKAQVDCKPYLIAVTVLTSMDQNTLAELGISAKLEDQVLNLAKLTQESKLHGVVCSAQEASLLRANTHKNFLLVTPGIRLLTDTKDDQTRIVTPEQALINGSSYLVIGRPITKAPEPLKALESILKSIS